MQQILTDNDIALAKRYHYEYSLIVDNIVLPTFIIPESYAFSRQVRMRHGDICIASYPKSGSTWLTLILLLLTRQGDMPKEKDLADTYWWPDWGADYMLTNEQLDAAPDPRLFRSHMPYQLAVGGVPADNPAKYIYMARQPRSVLSSYYNYARDFDTYAGPWEDFLRLFMEGKVWFGDWFDHVQSWWVRRDSGNILCLWYEDMKADFDTEVRKIADFAGYSLSGELLAWIRQATTYSSMRDHDLTNMKNADPGKTAPPKQYYRGGQPGAGNGRFTREQSDRFDAWCARRMQETGFDHRVARN